MREQNKRRKWPTWVRIVGFTLTLLLLITGAVLWALNSTGPLGTLFSAVFTALSTVAAVLQLIPLIFSAKRAETPTIPTATKRKEVRDQGGIRRVQAEPPPSDPRSILPRKKNVQDIYARLTQAGTTAVVLTGIGGIGKSTLASLVFNYVEDQRKANTGFFSGDSIWLRIDEKTTFLDLAASLYDAAGKALPDFGYLAPQNQTAVLFNMLRTIDRSRLVVLDQFENLLDWKTGHALPDRPGVSEWLDALNSQPCTCRILLTCRVWPEGSHGFPPTRMQEYSVKGLEISEGLELLRKHGVEERQAQDEELREAVVRFDAHALALELLASILRHHQSLKLKDLFEEQMYAHFWPENIARNLLDYIYKEQLDRTQRELLLVFSVFREPVRLTAAQAFMNGKSWKQLSDALDVLLKQHLIQDAGEGSYQLHAIVTDYASSHFNEKSDRANRQMQQAMHAKAIHYYLSLAAQRGLRPDSDRAMNDMRPFIETIWHQCQAKQWRKAFRLAKQEQLFIELRDLREYPTLLELCQLFLPEKRRLVLADAAFVCSNLAWAYDQLEKKEQALPYYEEALSMFEKLKDGWGQAETLNNLGGVYLALGERENALMCFEKAIDIGRVIWDRSKEGATLNNLGGIYYQQGDKEKARSNYEKSLQIRRKIGDRIGEGASLNNLGRVYLDMGEKEKAIACYEEVLRIRQEARDNQQEATTMQSLGEIYHSLGEQEKALSYIEKAWRMRRKVGDKAGESVALHGLGDIYKELGQREKALESYEEALHLKQEVKDRAGESATLLNIGELYFEQKHYNVALAYFLLAHNISDELQEVHLNIQETWISAIRQEIGEQQFATLLAKVEPRVQEIVEKSLFEGAYA